MKALRGYACPAASLNEVKRRKGPAGCSLPRHVNGGEAAMCLPCSYWWADVAVCRISGCEELSGLGLVVGNWDLLCAGGFGVKGLDACPVHNVFLGSGRLLSLGMLGSCVGGAAGDGTAR